MGVEIVYVKVLVFWFGILDEFVINGIFKERYRSNVIDES